MDKAFYETDEFLALRDEWYAKAKESGFEDLEVLDEITHQPGSLMRGVSPGDLGRSERRIAYKASSEEYYRLARQHVWTLPRGPQRHTARLHADGLSNREVVEAITKAYPEVKPGTVLGWVKKIRTALRREARHG